MPLPGAGSADPSVSSRENVTTEGIDIVLVLDVSGSMLAEDFSPNRLDAAKQVAAEFVDGRSNDRIGLVIHEAGHEYRRRVRIEIEDIKRRTAPQPIQATRTSLWPARAGRRQG